MVRIAPPSPEDAELSSNRQRFAERTPPVVAAIAPPEKATLARKDDSLIVPLAFVDRAAPLDDVFPSNVQRPTVNGPPVNR